MHIIIVGGSGLIGSHCIRHLLLDQRCTRVSSIGRRSLNINHAKLSERVGSLSQIDSLVDGLVYDAGICTLGTTLRQAGSQKKFREIDYELPLQFAKFLKKNDVYSFHVVTSLGADHSSRQFYLRVKGQLELALRGLNFSQLAIYQPSLLLGNRHENRPFEHLAVKTYKKLERFYPQILQSWKPIEAEIVAKFIVNEALCPNPGMRIFTNQIMHKLS